MNIEKRKLDECHYCANQTHNQKRSKLTICDRSEIMIPFMSNFKSREGRRKEIAFSPGNGIALINSIADFKQTAILEQEHDQPMDFKPLTQLGPERSSEFESDLLSCESPRFFRSGWTDMSSRLNAMSELRPSSTRSKSTIPTSDDELSINSEMTSRPVSVADCSRYDNQFLSSNESLLAPSHSDGFSSAGESSSVRSCRKIAKGSQQDSRTSKFTSSSRTRKKRYMPSLAQESLTLQTSNESLQDYLLNMSVELQRDRLLGKLNQREIHPGTSNRPDGFPVKQERTGESSYSLKVQSNSTLLSDQRTRSIRRGNTLKSSLIDRPCMDSSSKKNEWFWSRVFQLFSLGCWKTDINSSSRSVDRISRVNTISECDGSSGSESSSTSTGTTTVAAVAACGRDCTSKEMNDVKSTEEILTAKIPSSRASGSSDHKLMAAKLVESLKRFFSRRRKSVSDEESSEEQSDKSSSEESNSEPSFSAPLNPKQLPPRNSKLLSRQWFKSSPESLILNKHLLGNPAESSLSTENETSDAEFVDICPMHKQPI